LLPVFCLPGAAAIGGSASVVLDTLFPRCVPAAGARQCLR